MTIIPRPEWYFLSLFQFVKLGPALFTSILIPAGLLVGLILWPLLDASLRPPTLDDVFLRLTDRKELVT